MGRVRTDNVFGTVSDNPLTNVATTMNSGGLANLNVVAAPDEAIIVVDPNRLTGAPEIVVVTAHTGSATSATIVRGQFGTAARQHALGTEWVHGPVASNATTLVTAADDQGDYVPMGAWEAWTPTLTNMTLGNGTVTARFTRIGRTVHYRFKFTLGSTSAMGTNPTFTLPATVEPQGGNDTPIGQIIAQDTGTATFPGHVMIEAGDARMVVWDAAVAIARAASITSTVPFTWTTNDILTAHGTYETDT